jgi:hypothetical protein
MDLALYFTATSCVLSETIDIRATSLVEEAVSASREINQLQVIRIQLKPSGPGYHGDNLSAPKFSMFGTDRAITKFELFIHQISDPAGQEYCAAWGSVSYTAEVDFAEETTDDCILFYLYVKPETFARYAAKTALGSLDEIHFNVGSVDGFYSD